MTRIVCISNRVSLPDPETGEIKAGGLAVGVRAALEGMGGGVWFGWNGGIVKDAQERAQQGKDIRTQNGIEFITMPLTEKEFSSYYKGMANEGLWPFLHELAAHIDEDGSSFKTYKAVNKLFAEQIKPHLKPDDIIWVHDYHLMPLGKELRKMGVSNPILFFNHTPMPGPDFINSKDVPAAIRNIYQELAGDLFAYDQVGFQATRDLRKFAGSIGQDGRNLPARFNTAAFDFQGRQCQFGVFPISVETDQINEIAKQNLALERVQKLQRMITGKKLAVGADRLDYTKGLPERIEGVSRFLQEYKGADGQINFLQVTPLSRDDIKEYQRTIEKVRSAVMAVNGRYGDEFYKPINFTEQGVPRDVLMGYYRIANVGLVTSLIDGQHLGAKEFLAAQDPADPGVLVLSKHVGAAEELGENGALLIEPRDPQDMAQKLRKAFNMPHKERVARHERLIRHLRKNDINRWAKAFLKPFAP